MTDPVVSVRGLRKSFGDVDVLRDVDLDVHGDATTVLLGPNGSGKTVLLSCIAGGLSPSAGEVQVFGRGPGDVGAATSFMLQDGLAFPQLTGRETIEFYVDLHPAASDDWRELADRLDVADALDRDVGEYSGGTVRKLELLLTFAADVPLYLLDEPTAELDMRTVDTVHAIVDEYRKRGKTVLMSSHAPVDAQLADRIVFVQDGRIVESGRPEELMAAVPRVVTVDGHSGAPADRSIVRDGRFFEQNGQQYGFLPTEVDAEEVAGDGIDVSEPTVSEMFNYYVSVRPTETGGSGESTAERAEGVDQEQSQ